MPAYIYVESGTPITWAASGGTAVLTLNAPLAAGAGRQGDRVDLGSGARPAWYTWQFRWRAGATPTVGEVVRVYVSMGTDGTYQRGGLGTADAAVTSEALLANCAFLGSVEVDQASTSKDFVAGGLVMLRTRYVVPAVWNASAVALSTTAGHHEFRLTPVPDQVQNWF